MVSFRSLFSRNSYPGLDHPDVPGSSLNAIQRKRAASGGELRAHIYCHAGQRFLLTSVMSAPGYAMLETGDPTVLAADVSDAELGRSLCDHLLRYEARQPPIDRDAKKTDWAVYRASGDGSVTGFETRSVKVAVATANLVVEMEAAPLRSLHGEICVKATTGPDHALLGAALRRALRAVDALRRAEIV